MTYDSMYDYKVVNQTGQTIEVVASQERSYYEEGVRQFPITLENGQTTLIYTESDSDRKPEDVGMDAVMLSYAKIRIIVDGEPLSDKFKQRKYWKFSTRAYLGSYTLTLTPELVDELK